MGSTVVIEREGNQSKTWMPNSGIFLAIFENTAKIVKDSNQKLYTELVTATKSALSYCDLSTWDSDTIYDLLKGLATLKELSISQQIQSSNIEISLLALGDLIALLQLEYPELLSNRSSGAGSIIFSQDDKWYINNWMYDHLLSVLISLISELKVTSSISADTIQKINGGRLTGLFELTRLTTTDLEVLTRCIPLLSLGYVQWKGSIGYSAEYREQFSIIVADFITRLKQLEDKNS